MENDYPDNPYLSLRGVDESNGDTNLLFNYANPNGWYSSGWTSHKKGRFGLSNDYEIKGYNKESKKALVEDKVTGRLYYIPLNKSESKYAPTHDIELPPNAWTPDTEDEEFAHAEYLSEIKKQLSSDTENIELLQKIYKNYVNSKNAPADFTQEKLLRNAEEYKQLYESGKTKPGERYWAPTSDGNDLDMFQSPNLE